MMQASSFGADELWRLARSVPAEVTAERADQHVIGAATRVAGCGLPDGIVVIDDVRTRVSHRGDVWSGGWCLLQHAKVRRRRIAAARIDLLGAKPELASFCGIGRAQVPALIHVGNCFMVWPSPRSAACW
jgi:hypothetical protein